MLASRSVPPVTPRQRKLLIQARRLIARFAKQWNLPASLARTSVRIDPRLKRHIAVCSLGRHEIKLSASLCRRPNLLTEVLAHELAHLVVFQRHGCSARPHGAEWRHLLEAVGIKPRRT